jgi:hypothetical protein
MRLGFLLAGLITAFTLAPAATADAHRTSCPNGYTTYAVPQTEAELLELPRIAAGLAADPAPYTVEDLIALGGLIDANDDGLFCLKAVSNLTGESTKRFAYFYSGRDNDTAAA